MATRLQGEVKWFNDTKGYGMITPDDGSPEPYTILVYLSAIADSGISTLKGGQKVEYERTQSPKGVQASRVKVLEAEEGT
ncbi:cold shock-like protein cspE [Clathrospora elynae]|uniref:Cold shock-like protein cspE n=1 Tax=Clathrospora elynae TaxID=706981 RepID=A0A6A5S4H8_9PLEO|nr:cold shock-like protein cspE [Clathrospora elynae]